MLAMLVLNMAVLPCAMAFQGGDCAHCPPAEQHETGHEMAAHHSHDEAKPGPSCATVEADCCDELAVNVDTRGSKLESKPTGDVVFVTAGLFDSSAARPVAVWNNPSGPPETFATSPPLHALFCVYLK